MRNNPKPGHALRALLSALLLCASMTTSADDCPRPRIGLALGSGGAGGLAHIAMLSVFEERQIEPAAIAGTSIGAVIGALHAAGLESGEILDLFREFGGSAMDPFSGLLAEDGPPGLRDLVKVDLAGGSILDSGRFIDFIAGRFEAREFSELDKPLAIVATDYWTGEAVVFREGDLLEAIRASMAVPGLFAPVPREGQLLIDGGVSDPLPVDRLENVDVVVAIDVTGSRREERDGRPHLTDLLFNSFEIMQQSILRERLAQDRPDIYIKPELPGIRLLHFDRVDRIIEGAAPAADELRRALDALPRCR